MSDLRELARSLRPYIEQAAQSLSDADGLKAKALYPRWQTPSRRHGAWSTHTACTTPTRGTARSTSAPAPGRSTAAPSRCTTCPMSWWGCMLRRYKNDKYTGFYPLGINTR